MTRADDVTNARASRTVRTVRGVLLASFTFYMLVGPLVNQVVRIRVLHTHPSPLLPAWRMFGTRSLGVCQSEFLSVAHDGATTRLDRYALLDEGRFSSTQEFRRLKNKYEAEQVGARLCEVRARDDDAPDVRLHRRCADLTRGWNVTAKGDVNLCTASAPEPEPEHRRRRTREGAR